MKGTIQSEHMNMPARIHSNENGLDYTLHGDYYLPEILDPELEDKRTIGKWGMLHRQYLEHERPGLYSRLFLSGKLHRTLADVDEAAHRRHAQIMEQMKTQEGIDEELKSREPMEWVRRMNSIAATADETILNELIYT